MTDALTLRLDALTAAQCETVRQWRNLTPELWRTPFLLTEPQQAEFFRDVVCARRALSRYWAVIDLEHPESDRRFVGMVGLNPIAFENGTAEVSLVIDPSRRRSGIGREAVRLVLREAFARLRLEAVTAEVYRCNAAAVAFWSDVLSVYGSHIAELPSRKFYDGVCWPATVYTVLRVGWVAANKVSAEGKA